MNTSMKALSAAERSFEYEYDAKTRMGTRSDLGSSPKNLTEFGRSSQKAADEFGISRQSVTYAIKILKEAPPEMIELIYQGILSISFACKILKLDPVIRSYILSLGNKKLMIKEVNRLNK